MYIKSLKPMLMVAALGLAVSCSSKKDENNSNESSESELKSLGLSGVIDVKVPDSVSGKTSSSSLTSMNLAVAQKSREACELRSQIKEGMAQVSQLGDTICRIESFKEIQAGKKYNIKFKMPEGAGGAPPSGGPGAPPALLEEQPSMPSMQLFIKNTDGGNTEVYRCLDRKLMDYIKVKKDGDTRNGSFITKGDFSGGGFSTKFHAYASFKKTGDGATKIVIKDKLAMTADSITSNSIRVLNLNIAAKDGDKDGVSKVSSSYQGKVGTADFEFSSAAAFGPDYGSVVQKYGTFGYRAYFDNKTLTSVNKDNHPNLFGSGKPYDVKLSDMPAKLDPATATITDFPEGAWDCQDTEDIELSITEEVIKSCNEGGFEMPEQTCSGGEFGFVGDNETIDDSDLANPDELGPK